MTNLATRRRNGDVLRSITLVFGGVNYGTISVSAPYTTGQPMVLYLVSEHDGTGPIDALVTDDGALGIDVDMAR